MTQYRHGGDIETEKAYYSGELLDFSANINPLGMPSAVIRAAQDAILDAEQYPDPLCRKLRLAIARKEGLLPGHVLCGNGAADLIYRLALALQPKRGMVLAPTFSEYEEALKMTGCQVVHHRLSAANDFDLTEEILGHLTEDLDLLWLCNPNNPSGRLIDGALMDKILDRCSENNIFVAVDECFLELCRDGKPLTQRILEMPNLFLLRAFTKGFAIPGLRLGYGLCGDPALLDRMALCGPPWAVSVPAMAAGLAALEEDGFLEKSRAYIAEERDWLLAALGRLGLWVCEGAANYLLLRTSQGQDLRDALRSQGILIRGCGNYEGLDQSFFRVAVRRHEDNERLIEALSRCVEAGQ